MLWYILYGCRCPLTLLLWWPSFCLSPKSDGPLIYPSLCLKGVHVVVYCCFVLICFSPWIYVHFLLLFFLSYLFSKLTVPRPHLSFEALLVSGKSHDFGPISCPEPPCPPSSLSGITCGKQMHEAESKYHQRLRRLNIFPASKFEVLFNLNMYIVAD